MTKIFDSGWLYKKTSKGNLQQWKTWIEQSPNGFCFVYVEQGQLGGKLVTPKPTEVSKGKNIGKANETSIEDQAKQVVKTKINKKTDEGYFYTIEEAENEIIILPMLAQSFDKSGHRMPFPAVGQPKLDGHRMLALRENGKIKLMTRKGKPYENLQHLEKEIDNHLKDNNIVLDGELYTNKFGFQELSGLVRKKTLTSEEAEKIKLMEYHVYDCIDLNDSKKGFLTRFTEVAEIIKPMSGVVLVENLILPDSASIQSCHDDCVMDGYEGLIIRNVDGPYEINHRSSHLQKFKSFIDSEYKIVGFTDGVGNEKECIIFICETDEGQKFNVRPTGSQESRKQMYKNGNSYIGQELKVKYQELSNDFVPRFPVGIDVRWGYDK